MSQQQPSGRSHDQVIRRVEGFIESSMAFVDTDQLDASDAQRFVLCAYIYGTLDAFTKDGGLSEADIPSVYASLLDRLFEWTPEEAGEVTKLMQDSATDEELRGLMNEGMQAIEEWDGSAEAEPARLLAEILESVQEMEDDEEFDDSEE